VSARPALEDLLASQALLGDPRDGEETEHLERGGGKLNASAFGLAGDPREGEPTEPLEKGGGISGNFVSPLSAVGPRDGEDTEPIEENDW
jgi:hypothetical protein